MRAAWAVVLGGLIAAGASRAEADAIAPGMRGVGYRFEVENLAEYPDHVFILYPTTNSGFGYVLEPGVSLIEVMWNGRGDPEQATRLHAMRRRDFERFAANAERHPHGDRGESVLVVEEPPGPPRSLRASAAIEPPGAVFEDSPIGAIHRTYRISQLTARRFELTLVREETEPYTRPAPTPSPLAPSPSPPRAPAPTPAPPPSRSPAPPPSRSPAPAAATSSGCTIPAANKTAFPLAGLAAGALLITLARRRR